MSGLGFSRKLRLLTAADYQPVFRQARYKVSCPQLLVLAIDNHSSFPRIGLVIAKKHVRTAVQRNRVKRLIRESFRHNQHLLTGLDIVILARSGVDSLNNQQIHLIIESLWQDLIRRVARSRQPSTE